MASKKELMSKIERLEETIRDLSRENNVQLVELRQYREISYAESQIKRRENQIDALVEYRKKLAAGGFSDENIFDIIGMLIERGNIIY